MEYWRPHQLSWSGQPSPLSLSFPLSICGFRSEMFVAFTANEVVGPNCHSVVPWLWDEEGEMGK